MVFSRKERIGGCPVLKSDTVHNEGVEKEVQLCADDLVSLKLGEFVQ